MEESSKYISKFLLTLQPPGDTLNQENIKICMKIIHQTLSHSEIANSAVEKIHMVKYYCSCSSQLYFVHCTSQCANLITEF